MVKYRNWISINRQELDESTKPEEISFLLNNIRVSVESKYYKFLGIDTARLDSFANKATSGLKGHADASKALLQMEGPEGRREIAAACPDQKLKKVAQSYTASRIIENLGIRTHLDASEMLKLYPDLKIYKKKMPKGVKLGSSDKESEDETE
ncbi:MAG: DUF2666 family protein [Candidatus Micrarchaeota archaeon]|nr:DUF2666 family protein [Candidatus Micrarchaeota archaeon]